MLPVSICFAASMMSCSSPLSSAPSTALIASNPVAIGLTYHLPPTLSTAMPVPSKSENASCMVVTSCSTSGVASSPSPASSNALVMSLPPSQLSTVRSPVVMTAQPSLTSTVAS